jgi:hypothetical protein
MQADLQERAKVNHSSVQEKLCASVRSLVAESKLVLFLCFVLLFLYIYFYCSFY